MYDGVRVACDETNMANGKNPPDGKGTGNVQAPSANLNAPRGWHLESVGGFFMAADESAAGRLVGLLDAVTWLQVAHKLPRQAVAQMVADSLPTDVMQDIYLVRTSQYAESAPLDCTFGYMPMALQGHAIAKLCTVSGATVVYSSGGIDVTFRTADELRSYCRPEVAPGLAALRQALVADAVAGPFDVPRCSRVAIRLSQAQELWGCYQIMGGAKVHKPLGPNGQSTDPANLVPHDGWRLHSELGYMGLDNTPAGRVVRLADLVRWLMDRESLPRADALRLVCDVIQPALMPFLYVVGNKGERASLVSPECGFGYLTPKGAEAARQRTRQLASEQAWHRPEDFGPTGWVFQSTSLPSSSRAGHPGGGLANPTVEPGAVALVKRMKACWAFPKLRKLSTYDSLDDPKSGIDRIAMLMTKAHELFGYGQPAVELAAPTAVAASLTTVQSVQAIALDSFDGLADELRQRFDELIRQRGKTLPNKGKKGASWTDTQRVTAADVVAALDGLRPGTGLAALSGALGVALSTFNGTRGVLKRDAVEKSRKALTSAKVKALASHASPFSLGDSMAKEG
jgi:hypothetical protein